MLRRALLFLSLASLACAAAAWPAGAARADCGLSGAFRVYSARIVYTGGGAGGMTEPTRELVLSGGRWQFGASAGSFRVAPIAASDWKRWGASPYGPTEKIVLSGWAGGSADGPIEGPLGAVDFLWVLYPVRPPLVSAPGIVELKFGHAVIPRSCPGSKQPAAGRARLTVTPAAVRAGATVHVVAGPFQPDEELSITDTYVLGGRKQTAGLLGGNADARGMLRFDHETLPEAPTGEHLLCVRGGNSGEVACGAFVVEAAAGGASKTTAHGAPGPGTAPAPAGPPTTTSPAAQAPAAGGGWQPPKVGSGYKAPGTG